MQKLHIFTGSETMVSDWRFLLALYRHPCYFLIAMADSFKVFLNNELVYGPVDAKQLNIKMVNDSKRI